MAIQTTGQWAYPAHIPMIFQRNLAFTTTVLDAAGKKNALICIAPLAGSLTAIHFRSGTVTTSGDADVRLETVDTSTGKPTGTLFATNSNATVTVNAANTWFRVPLTAAATTTRTNLIAAVVVNTTGSYQTTGIDSTALSTNYPYGAFYNNVSWANQASTPCMLLEYSGPLYPFIPGVWPVSAITAVQINTGSTPDEAGLKLTSFPVATQTFGCWAYLDQDANGQLLLYNASDTVVATSDVAVDPDIREGTAQGLHYFTWDSDVTLAASSTYRLIMKPTSGSNLSIMTFDINNAAYMSAMPQGSGAVYTNRTDAGSWSDATTTRAPLMGLLMNGMDSGSGGAVMFHPGMAGGMTG